MFNGPLKSIRLAIGIISIALLISSPAFSDDDFLIGIAQWVDNPQFTKNVDGFIKGLSNHGFVEGENITFIRENPHANKDNQRKIIAKFIDKKVDLIYSLTTPGTLIAKEMAPDIPIVFSIVTFPAEAGVIDSLESSGNNLVGTRNYLPPERQFFYFDRMSPKTKTLAFAHRKGEPNSIIQLNEYIRALKRRNVDVMDIAAVDLEDLKKQLTANASKIDAVFSACDTLIQSGGEEVVIEFSLSHKKPTFTCNKDGVLKGALIGNVADFQNIGEMSGEKAAMILKGTRPSDIPTESPRTDYVVVNKATAEYLSLSIPSNMKRKISEMVE